MAEKIEWEGKVFALILRHDYEPNGINFVTPEENPLQLGVLKYQHGARIKPHFHKSSQRIINQVQEVLHIVYGIVEAEFYKDTGEKVKSCILNPGDTILLLSGGHGFTILENAKIIEVKQGPYHGFAEDKERM